MTTKKQDYDNQYYKNNKERIAERKKLYRQNNKNKILEQEKISRDKLSDEEKCKRAEKCKASREVNKEKISERDRRYYNDNKEKINERRNTKYTCVCGACIRKGEKAPHERTKKHIKFLESQ